jgi:hypothetical protein
MRPSYLIESAVFAAGIAIGVACANDSSAQTVERIVPDDTTAVMRLVRVVRGANPLVCEMTVRTADMRGSWMNWGSVGSSALVIDSTASSLLDWVQHSHNDPALVPPLSAAIRDDDLCVRRVAASLLSHVRHPAATDALRDALADAKPGTREVAALGLGMSDARSAVDPLMARLHDDTPAVRCAVAWALGELEARKALPGLIDLLAKDPDARVRQAAAWAIGNIH